MDIDTCMAQRKSTRHFESARISHEDLTAILHAATLAPSPKNRQPWRFVVLSGEAKGRVVQLMREGMSEGYDERLMPNEVPSGTASAAIIASAPVLVLVFNHYPSGSVKSLELLDVANIQAIGAAIQNMLLEATSRSISSLWICDIFAAKKPIEREYPGMGSLIASVSLGYSKSDVESMRTSRMAVDDVTVWRDQNE